MAEPARGGGAATTYWCVFTMALRLILPDLIASFSTGATLPDRQLGFGRSEGIVTHSAGFAGSTMTASLDSSSTTRYA